MKKKILALAAILAASAAAVSALDLGLSISASPSPLYAWSWAPGMDGAALAIDLRKGFRGFDLRSGIEAGVSDIGTQLLFPIRLERGLWASSSGSPIVVAEAGVHPGLALFKPYPLFMVGAELGASCRWNLSPALSLEAGIALRYLTCPAYSALISDYEVVDVPLAVGIRYRLGATNSR